VQTLNVMRPNIWIRFTEVGFKRYCSFKSARCV